MLTLIIGSLAGMFAASAYKGYKGEQVPGPGSLPGDKDFIGPVLPEQEQSYLDSLYRSAETGGGSVGESAKDAENAIKKPIGSQLLKIERALTIGTVLTVAGLAIALSKGKK